MTAAMKNHTVAKNGTMILFAALIVLFLLFITIPIISLFTGCSITDLISAISSETAISALKISAFTALVSTIVIILFGTPLAYMNARIKYRFKNVVDTITDLPMVLPPTVAGLALLLAFGKKGLLGECLFDFFGIKISYTVIAVIIAQIFVASPFFIRQARSAFEAIPIEYEYASKTLGAGMVKTFFRITLPLAGGAVLSGIIMSFARALGEFGATMMFAGNMEGITQTMPMAIYVAQNFNMNISIALSIILVLFSFFIILIVKYISDRQRMKYA